MRFDPDIDPNFYVTYNRNFYTAELNQIGIHIQTPVEQENLIPPY